MMAPRSTCTRSWRGKTKISGLTLILRTISSTHLTSALQHKEHIFTGLSLTIMGLSMTTPIN